MKSYYLEEFGDEQQYCNFIEFMLKNSQYFSLVYDKGRKNTKMKSSVRFVYEALRPYKLYRENTKKWPNTETWDDSVYSLVFYKCDMNCEKILKSAGNIFNWYQPDFPMDLCFYRDGYCWLSITAHEEMAVLYTDDEENVKNLQKLGADLSFCEEIDDIYIWNGV